MVGVIGIKFTTSLIFQRGLCIGVDLAKVGLQASVELVFLNLAGDELALDPNKVGLVLPNAVRDGVLDKLVERLNLLVDDTVLLKERVNDLPLVIDVDLVLAVLIDGSLRVEVATLL